MKNLRNDLKTGKNIKIKFVKTVLKALTIKITRYCLKKKMKRKTFKAILYYEINFINCLNFVKTKNKYEIIFISSAFFDSLN